MNLNDMLRERNMSRYRLSKQSGIPQATLSDIFSGKAKMYRCSAETVYRLAQALDVSMESLLEPELSAEKRSSFDVYRSGVCHLVKDMGEVEFAVDMLERDEVSRLYDKKWYPEAFYMLAMIDYLCNKHEVPLCSKYDELRCQRLKKTVYPSSAVILDAATNTDEYKEQALKNATPEFMRFNIVESEVENVC
ncbi:MAG: helix-turn-helix transcriptional regulator [Clostridia bacterium]|nr:helix-turn-helix transcriptional regulator [Clostridia bacterium]